MCNFALRIWRDFYVKFRVENSTRFGFCLSQMRSADVGPEMPRQRHASLGASPSDLPVEEAFRPETGSESGGENGSRSKSLASESVDPTSRPRFSRRRNSPKSTLVVRRVNEDEEEVGVTSSRVEDRRTWGRGRGRKHRSSIAYLLWSF